MSQPSTAVGNLNLKLNQKKNKKCKIELPLYQIDENSNSVAEFSN